MHRVQLIIPTQTIGRCWSHGVELARYLGQIVWSWASMSCLPGKLAMRVCCLLPAAAKAQQLHEGTTSWQCHCHCHRGSSKHHGYFFHRVISGVPQVAVAAKGRRWKPGVLGIATFSLSVLAGLGPREAASASGTGGLVSHHTSVLLPTDQGVIQGRSRPISQPRQWLLLLWLRGPYVMEARQLLPGRPQQSLVWTASIWQKERRSLGLAPVVISSHCSNSSTTHNDAPVMMIACSV